jgi:SNF2 family DNA or RNA helicase
VLLLLSDEMGLGKTIESIAGMILYNGIEEHRTGKKRPSLIVTPNRAVLDQWIEALKRNGVRRNRIKTFTKGMAINHTGNDFILMEKSKLQIEIKAIFSAIIDKKSKPDSSSLFPHITREDYRKLCTQYRAAQGKEKNIFRRNGELPDDCVRRLVEGMVIRMQQQNKEASFRTVVIDECHFLKNQLAYWGIAGLLLSAHSERAIPMSGTP